MRLLLVLAFLATAYGMYFPPGNGGIWVLANHPIQRNRIAGPYPPNWPYYPDYRPSFYKPAPAGPIRAPRPTWKALSTKFTLPTPPFPTIEPPLPTPRPGKPRSTTKAPLPTPPRLSTKVTLPTPPFPTVEPPLPTPRFPEVQYNAQQALLKFYRDFYFPSSDPVVYWN